MQAFPEYVNQLRNDVRLLRVDKDRLTRAHQSQKEKAERLEKQLKEQAKRIKELEKENANLKEEREQSTKTKTATGWRSLITAISSIPRRRPRRTKADKQAIVIPIERASRRNHRRGQASTSLSQRAAPAAKSWRG